MEDRYYPAERTVDPALHGHQSGGQERDPPEAVDDAGDRGEEVDEVTDPSPQPGRRQLGHEQGAPHGDGQRHGHRHDARRERPERQGGDPEVRRRGVREPLPPGEEPKARSHEGGAGLHEEEGGDRAEQREHDEPPCPGDGAEHRVTAAAPTAEVTHGHQVCRRQDVRGARTGGHGAVTAACALLWRSLGRGA